MKRISSPVVLLALLGLAVAVVQIVRHKNEPSARIASATQQRAALAIALTPPNGDSSNDRGIRDLQEKIKSAAEKDKSPLLERLGWAYVNKARVSSDPGFYSLAEKTAEAMRERSPQDAGASLLLGHTWHALHRFAAAEEIARRLVSQREFVFDYALLGDVLMEQGKLGEAVDAYQKMVDLKPCLQTYSRVAHMRWLKGDLDGAIAASRLAISAGSAREPEPTAWAYARLAFYQLQAGDTEQAQANVALALQLLPDYAPAKLMEGRVLLAAGRAEEAAGALRIAAEASPLPEYLWTLCEALRAAGDERGAGEVEAQLARTGRITDGRTFSLFLATRGQDPAAALQLANAELEARRDVFTYDALAWAEFRAGQLAAAQEHMGRALAEGTQDARLFYHAGTIAAAAQQPGEALAHFTQARRFERTLLPSERDGLSAQLSALTSTPQQISTK